jgi:hypothetical protein
MFVWLVVGFLFAVGVGVAAKDAGMVRGALVCFVGGALAVPFVARLWR